VKVQGIYYISIYLKIACSDTCDGIIMYSNSKDSEYTRTCI